MSCVGEFNFVVSYPARAVRNLTVDLLQIQHTADGDQWKVIFIFSAGYVFSASFAQR